MKKILFISLLAFSASCSGTASLVESNEIVSVEAATDEALGKADSALTSNTEVKVTLRSADITSATKVFKLTSKAASKREIWFYDTPELALFEDGLLLRARKISNAPDDSTVKIRPMDRDAVDDSWFEADGFKCETDQSGERSTSSCSLTVEQDSGEIGDVASGDRAPEKLFGSDQEDFASNAAQVGWDEVVPLGPIAALAWKVNVKGMSVPVSFERWDLPGMAPILEASMRVSEEDAADATEALIALLERKGFEPDSTQETKTKLALDHFSGAGEH